VTTATLLIDLRHRGVIFAACDGRLTFDAPVGLIQPILKELRVRKAELLAILAGDYARAAMMLLSRETQPGARRNDLVMLFDERLAICEIDGGLRYGDACRVAYLQLTRALDGGTA
jgi:hypothetical protein